MVKRIGGTEQNLDDVAWTNNNAKVVTEFTCFVPKKIHDIIRSANIELPNEEFSFLLKCDIDNANQHITIQEEVFFPKQTVTSGHVDYEEDAAGYNGVIHKHPAGCLNFSGTDTEWINQNFAVSLLWLEKNGFIKGIMNISTPAGKVQLPVKIEVETDFIPMEDIQALVKEKATKKTFVTHSPYKYGGTRGAYNQWSGNGSIFAGLNETRPGAASDISEKVHTNTSLIHQTQQVGDSAADAKSKKTTKEQAEAMGFEEIDLTYTEDGRSGKGWEDEFGYLYDEQLRVVATPEQQSSDDSPADNMSEWELAMLELSTDPFYFKE